MLTKDSSNLYKYIIEDLKVEPSTIMHIGDNFHSDFNNPKLYKIDSVYIEKIIDTFLENNIRAKKLLNENKNNIAVSIMLGISAFSSLNNFNKNENKENNYWRNFGFVYGGPAVFSYMSWLKKQIIKDNINEVLFVARDGYSLKKVFDLIKPESVKTHYIYAPRIIYYLITLDFSMIKYFRLDDAIKSVLEFYKDKDEYLQKRTPKITSAIEGYKFILSNIEIYKKLAKKEYQNYKEYIEKFNIEKNNIAVVDTCSLFKTSQKIISLFLGRENIIGYYFILLKNKIYKSNQYFAKSFEKEGNHKILDWNLAEFLITSPEPPIKNIIDLKPVYSVASKYEENRMKIYEYISDGIVEFSKIAKNCFWELETFISNEEVTNFLNILIDNPSDRDKKYFKSMRMYEDTNHKDKAVYVIQRWFIKKSGKKYYLFSFIPFLTKEKFAGGEIKYYLFSFIPIIKIKIAGNMRKYYLFTVINILTIRIIK